MWSELSSALEQTIAAIVDAPAGSLVITEAQIELPIEVAAARRRGEIVFFGSAAHTRWVSGVLPPVHVARFCVGLLDAEERCGR